ncbi:MAG TPA: MarR family transcriptional regulator [Halalkalibaculum sp.]|nr:MarR family transcriptional regulator [Halalkalibaculum sp.]
MSTDQISYCDTLGCRMAYVVKEIIRILKKRFQEQEIELTIEQFFILNILDNEDGLILQEVAEIVDRDKSAVLRHVDGLERKHFVTRMTDSSDKRRKLLLVTKRGMEVLKKARAVDAEIDRAIAGRIQDIEVKEFEAEISNIYDFLINKDN